MKPIYFITGTDTGAGKTVLTALLAQSLRERGVSVAALKPICSGGREDAKVLQAALDGALTLDEINPWHYRAPIAPLQAARLERKRLLAASVCAHIRATQKRFDVTVVEGAGGLFSPLGEGFDSLTLITRMRASPIIVAPNRLGVINHLLLTLRALPKPVCDRASVVLMNPAQPDSATDSNAGLLVEFFPNRQIFTLPWLGRKFSTSDALKKKPVQRVIHALLSAVA